MPMRANSSAATAAAIGSLSTNTPWQSKMSTKRPASAPSGPALDCAIESSWQKGTCADGKSRAPRRRCLFCTGYSLGLGKPVVCREEKGRKGDRRRNGLIEFAFDVGDALRNEIIGDFAFDSMGEDRLGGRGRGFGGS